MGSIQASLAGLVVTIFLTAHRDIDIDRHTARYLVVLPKVGRLRIRTQHVYRVCAQVRRTPLTRHHHVSWTLGP